MVYGAEDAGPCSPGDGRQIASLAGKRAVPAMRTQLPPSSPDPGPRAWLIRPAFPKRSASCRISAALWTPPPHTRTRSVSIAWRRITIGDRGSGQASKAA